jgi:NADPH:quinone reductase-like Zn-dependent oxidoreductase
MSSRLPHAMKAAVYTRLGPPEVVEIKEVATPVPSGDEVLIKVRVASANPLDWRLMRGVPGVVGVLFRVSRPTIAQPARLGRDVSGEVVAVGANVTRFRPGDPVFGWCRGAFAEFACTPESALVLKPDPVTFEQAASVPVAGLTALQGLRDKGRLRAGQEVLINGAAGGVGTFAVQIAASFGAVATGVCSTGNVEMVRSIGARRVVDYTREDFTAGPQRYDLILDCVGNRSLTALRRATNPGGACVIAGAPKNPGGFLARTLTAPLWSWAVRRRFALFMARLRGDDLAVMGELIAAGKVTPVIDRRFGLSQAAEAIRYLEAGHARGKVVITIE